MSKRIKFLAIGDLATDAFIKIKDAEVKCDLHGENCKLCLNFGDKIPYESVEVCSATGNASNIAVAVKRLGLDSSLVSYTGGDNIGIENLKYLKKQKVNVSNVKIIKNLQSNYHYIIWYKAERTILTKHTEFPYSFPKNFKNIDFLYLTSLAENSLGYHDEIVGYLKSNPNTFLIFQPGTFQIKFGYERLKDIYQRSNIFLCNHEEAKRILQKEEENNIPDLLKGVYSLGPKIVVITDGINGAYAYDGKDVWFVEAYPHTPLESTGAGDAFSGAFITALILNKKIDEALVWGSVNAMSVTSQVGPQKGLMTIKELEKYIKNLSEDYKARKIN